MPELDFAGLREHLESAARPPAFAEIRGRRSARTRRTAVVAAALATAAALVGSGTAVALLAGGAHVPPPVTQTTTLPSPSSTPSPLPSPSPSTSPTTGPGAGPADLLTMASAPDGALIAIAEQCVAGCTTATPQVTDTLLRSTDLGAQWDTVGQLPGARSRLLVADASHLWAVGAATVSGSSDGGVTWHDWSLGPDATAGGTDIRASVVASGVAWFARGDEVWRATAGGPPQRMGSLAGGSVVIDTLAALDGQRAYAIGETGQQGATWSVTSDGGAHWTLVADPCAGTRFPASPNSSLAASPDGALWVVCAGSPGMGQMPKDLVVSTNGGGTWVPRGELEPNGYGTDVRPFSATLAWRTGGRADILRTTDGTQWTDLVNLQSNGPRAFVALDPQTAVYAAQGAGGMQINVTHDGGATWRSYPFG
jgi:hypothetical protein